MQATTAGRAARGAERERVATRDASSGQSSASAMIRTLLAAEREDQLARLDPLEHRAMGSVWQSTSTPSASTPASPKRPWIVDEP